MRYAAIAVLVTAAALAVVYFIRKSRATRTPATDKPNRRQWSEAKTVGVLSLEEVLRWFKQPNIAALHQNGENCIAVLIQHPEGLRSIGLPETALDSTPRETGKTQFAQCIFDESSGIILEHRLWQASSLDNDLIALFGDKKMVVFK